MPPLPTQWLAPIAILSAGLALAGCQTTSGPTATETVAVPAPAPVAAPDRSAGPRRLAIGRIAGMEGSRADALAGAMRRALGELGYVVVPAVGGDVDATLVAEATLNPPEDGRQRLAVIWTLTDRSGEPIGEVRQMARLRQGTLDRGAEAEFRRAVEAALPGVVALAPPRR